MSSYLEILEMEHILLSANPQQLQFQQQYPNAFVNLDKALGAGWISKADEGEITGQRK